MISITRTAHSKVEPSDQVFLQMALYYLMTYYSLQPSSGVAGLIAQRLQILLDHPEETDASGTLGLYRQLLQQWQHLAPQS